MFDCGITTYTSEIANQIRKNEENFVYSAVHELFVDIDKEQFEKCLLDSKSFYDDGYKEGYDKGFEDALTVILNDIKAQYFAMFKKSMIGGNQNEDS